MGEQKGCPTFERRSLSRTRYHQASTCPCGWSRTADSETELARQESAHRKQMLRKDAVARR